MEEMEIYEPESFEEALEWNQDAQFIDSSCINAFRKYKEEALPHFLNLLKETTEDNVDEMMDNSLLAALYMLSENHCEEAFPEIARILPFAEYDLGDCASHANEFLYHTFDGNFELLDDLLFSPEDSGILREAPLYCYGQLYLDGIVSRSQMRGVLEGVLNPSMWFEGMFTEVLDMIADLGFTEFEDILLKYENLYDMFVGYGSSGLISRVHGLAKPSKTEYCYAVFSMEDALWGVDTPEKIEKQCLDGVNAHLDRLREIVSKKK